MCQADIHQKRTRALWATAEGFDQWMESGLPNVESLASAWHINRLGALVPLSIGLFVLANSACGRLW